MKEQIERPTPVTARIKVELPPERVNEHLNEFYGSVSKRVRLPGFRPGKAPLHVVKKYYAEEATNSIGEQLVSDALRELVRKHNLHLILPPTLIAVDAPKEDQAFKFEAELDLKPQLPALKIEGIEIEDVEAATDTDKLLEERLALIQEQYAEYRDIETNRPAQMKDIAVVQYEGSVDGEKIAKASNDRYEFTIGRRAVLPEFETHVLGMSPGQSKEFAVEFSPDHPTAEVKGKTIQFKLTLFKLREPILPNWTDELATQVDPKIKSLLEFRLKIRGEIEENAREQKFRQQREAIGRKLVELHPFDVSQRQRNYAAQGIARERIQSMIQMGMSEDMVKSKSAEILEAAVKEAEYQIRLAYILEQISRDHNIKATNEDVEGRFDKIAKSSGLSLSDIQKFYAEKEEGSDASRADRLRLELQDEKSLDYALSKATIKSRGASL